MSAALASMLLGALAGALVGLAQRAELHRECERYRLAASSIEQECVIRFGRDNGKPR